MTSIAIRAFTGPWRSLVVYVITRDPRNSSTFEISNFLSINLKLGRAGGTRTRDPMHPMHVRCQLRYSPIIYELCFIHHLFTNGKDNVERIYPTAGTNAFSNGYVSPIKSNHTDATRYVTTAINPRLIQLVSHPLSASTRLLRDLMEFSSLATSSRFINSFALFHLKKQM